MAPARLDNTRIDVAANPAGVGPANNPPYLFRATGSIVTFPGWMAVYAKSLDEKEVDELDKGQLPDVVEREPLDLEKLLPKQHFTQPPQRYSEAPQVKALK